MLQHNFTDNRQGTGDDVDARFATLRSKGVVPKTSARACIAKGDLRATPPRAITPLIGTPARREAFDNVARAKGGGLHQRPEHRRGASPG